MTVAGTVAAVGDGVSDGAVANTGTVKKRNFHTGLEPVSRTNNSAQPTEFDAGADTADKVRFAQLFSLDTGSSPVWSAVADTDATDDDHAAVGTVATVGGGTGDGAVAAVTVTVASDETIVTDGNHLKSSFRQDAGIQSHGQQVTTERGGGTANSAGDTVTIARRRRCR